MTGERAPRPEDWAAYARALGVAMQRRRIDLGLSQEDVAYRAGLSRYTYQKFEKAESRPGTPANPTLKTVLSIAQVLRCELGDLLPPLAPDLSAR